MEDILTVCDHLHHSYHMLWTGSNVAWCWNYNVLLSSVHHHHNDDNVPVAMSNLHQLIYHTGIRKSSPIIVIHTSKNWGFIFTKIINENTPPPNYWLSLFKALNDNRKVKQKYYKNCPKTLIFILFCSLIVGLGRCLFINCVIVKFTEHCTGY